MRSLHPLDRAVYLSGQKGQNDGLGISGTLDAKLAAHVSRNDPDGMLRQTHDVGNGRLDQVRRATGGPYRQPLLPAVVVGDYAPALYRHAGLTREVKGLVQHQAGPGECAVNIAVPEPPVEHDVVVHPGVDYRGIGSHRLFDATDDRERLVLHGHRLRHVLGRVGRLGGDCHDGVSHERNFAGRYREPVVWPRILAGAGRGGPNRVHMRQHLVRRDNADGPRHPHRPLYINRYNVGVSVLAAHESGVAHSRQFHVVQELPPPANQASQLRTGNLLMFSHCALLEPQSLNEPGATCRKSVLPPKEPPNGCGKAGQQIAQVKRIVLSENDGLGVGPVNCGGS